MTSSPLVDEKKVSDQHKKMKNRRMLLCALVAPMVLVASSALAIANNVPISISLMIIGSVALALMATSYGIGHADGFEAGTEYSQWKNPIETEETYAAEWLRLNKAMKLRPKNEKQDDHTV